MGRVFQLSYCTSFASQGITQDNKVIHVQICFFFCAGLEQLLGSTWVQSTGQTQTTASSIVQFVCIFTSHGFACFAVVHHVITMCVRLRPTFWARFSWKRQTTTRGHSKMACCSMLSSSFLFFRNIHIIPSSRPVLIWIKKSTF